LIPTQMLGLWPSLLGKYGLFRQKALVWPMASDSATAAIQTGDVTVYAPGSGVAPTASSPGFTNVGLNARKMMTLTAIDRELTEDMAIAVGELVGRSIARAFAKNEDKIGFLGDGTSTYFNFFGLIPSILKVDATPANIQAIQVQATAGTWAAIAKGDITGMVGRLDDDADDEDCEWYGHRNFFYTVIVPLALSLGGTTTEEWLGKPYNRQPTLLGRPFNFSRVFPRVIASADHVPLLLGNLQMAAVIGQSRQLTVEQSTEAYFTTDQIGIRGTERIALSTNHAVGGLSSDDNAAGPAVVGLLADIS